MILQTLTRAINILKFEKNTYSEIMLNKSSVYGSFIIIILAALVNTGIFKIYLLPNLPNKVPLQYIFIIWIFFNWLVFSLIVLSMVKLFDGKQNLNDKKIALSFIGYSNTAEILKFLIILFPNFIVLVSWGVLMLVIASQVLGVKQIYNVHKTSTAIGVIIISYVAQFFLIGFLVFFLIKLAY